LPIFNPWPQKPEKPAPRVEMLYSEGVNSTSETPSPVAAVPLPGAPLVRRCTQADVAALSLVGAATFLESFAGILDGANILEHCAYKHSEKSYRAALASTQAAAWLAEARGAPVGYAMVTPPTELPVPLEPGDLELKRIYLLSRFHGTGTGVHLMEQASEFARASGAGRLLLGVYAENKRALSFYRRQSFTEVGTRTFHIGSGTYHDLILALQLT
jgi:ribosomal protein S18 acetylase RimI-like enzyme